MLLFGFPGTARCGVGFFYREYEIMELRHYQETARQSVWAGWMRAKPAGPQLVVIPTGGGKTPLIASLVSDCVEQYGGRVLLLSHVKEILDQPIRR